MEVTEHELRQMYCYNKMTQLEIADVYGVGHATISRRMKEHGIKSRYANSAKPLKPSEEKLYNMYWVQKMSLTKIAKKIGVTSTTVHRWMEECGIETRTYSDIIGEKSGGWRGGISGGKYCYKFNNLFKEAVRERDDNTCQLCGFDQTGEKLSVHHIHYDKADCWPDVVALCRSCNGKVNGNRDYWEEYFENQLLERGLMYWSLSQET